MVRHAHFSFQTRDLRMAFTRITSAFTRITRNHHLHAGGIPSVSLTAGALAHIRTLSNVGCYENVTKKHTLTQTDALFETRAGYHCTVVHQNYFIDSRLCVAAASRRVITGQGPGLVNVQLTTDCIFQAHFFPLSAVSATSCLSRPRG